MRLAVLTLVACILPGCTAAQTPDALPCLTPTCEQQRVQEITDDAWAKYEADERARIEKINAEREAMRRNAEIRAARDDQARAERAQIADEQAAERRLVLEEERRQAQATYDAFNADVQNAGFEGYVPMSVFELLVEARTRGGLENVVGHVVGCLPTIRESCRTGFDVMKVSQVLPEVLLWSYVGFHEGDTITVRLMTDREPGKLYQEGQVFDNGLYVFTGMETYSSVIGASRTVPRFKPFHRPE